jgi:NAD(P)-dependent dehydrogenase (short-subunit alcohol dehydrogenase family)
MTNSLERKVAIVTGGTLGIGLEIARLFVREGARVLLVGRDPSRGATAIGELGEHRAAFHAGDVADPATAGAAMDAARERFGGLDILVNNAAMDHDEPLLDVLPETSLRVFATNFHGSLWMLQAAAGAMIAQGRGGAVVNVSSRLASVGVPGMSVYGAAKGALSALTRGAAIDLAPHGIRVNAVAPGFTETPLLAAWLAEQPDPERARAEAVAGIPLQRLGAPADVAAAVAFLASDAARHVTGASLAIDGGYTAR